MRTTKVRSKLSLLFIALAALIAIPAAVALADNVVNDVTVGGNDTFAAGGSTTINYWIVSNNGDGQTGCNPADTSKATVTINTPTGVTATPGTLEFAACGISNDQEVKFSSSTPGDYEITASVADSGTGTYNTSPAKFTLHVTGTTPPSDTTPPGISYVLNPASPDGANDWYKSNVTLTWNVSEPDSPSSLVKSGCVDQNITADQTEQTYSCSATSDGGEAGPVSVSIKRDATKPVITLTGGPANGSSYDFGSVPPAPSCEAADATSGPPTQTCNVSGYSTAVGTHTLKATATDNAGNTAEVERTYTVDPWTLNGFFQPVDMDTGTTSVWNTVKGGSTVPLKFEVLNKAGTTEFTDIGVVDSFAATPVACPKTGFLTDAIEFTTTGSSTLRYDTTAGQFIQNWQTPKKPGACYDVKMLTDDGSKLVAHFQLK